MLDQRVARVHRMGQHRPVQVFNLVMRDSIEERVLRTLQAKRSLFAGVFSGTSDEVLFAELGQRAFLETVRALLGEEVPAPESEPSVAPAPAADPRQALVQAGVQFLEALAAVLAASPKTNGQPVPPSAWVGKDAQTGQPVLQVPLPSPELMHRGAAALQALLRGVSGQVPSPSGEPK